MNALPVGTKVVAGAFAVSGVIHLVRPRVFIPLVPRPLPRHEAVIVSGVAELVCAAGLLVRARWAPTASAALLLAVWPGNLQMALDLQRSDRPAAAKVAGWARLPVQLPLIAAAWRSPVRQGPASD
ncbi:MAG: hypothetical protein ACOYEV_02255 [Candidatus Nanopelagicales bacterium]